MKRLIACMLVMLLMVGCYKTTVSGDDNPDGGNVSRGDDTHVSTDEKKENNANGDPVTDHDTETFTDTDIDTDSDSDADDTDVFPDTDSDAIPSICKGAIVFPDNGLEEAVRSAINKPTGDLYYSDVARVTVLHPNLYKEDLTGIQCLTNLEELDLKYCFVSDISPLSRLTKLTYLAIGNLHRGNDLSDLTPLKNLKNLETLYLSDNSISDITSLSGLTRLKKLGLMRNNISDLTPLSGLTGLVQFRLSQNPISDITPLGNFKNLTELVMEGAGLSDISPLANLTRLTNLLLPDNQISDISPLVANTGLGSGDTVNIVANPLDCDDATTLSHIATLESRQVDLHHGCD